MWVESVHGARTPLRCSIRLAGVVLTATSAPAMRVARVVMVLLPLTSDDLSAGTNNIYLVGAERGVHGKAENKHIKNSGFDAG